MGIDENHHDLRHLQRPYSDELDQVATNLDRLHATETVNPTNTGQEPDKSN